MSDTWLEIEDKGIDAEEIVQRIRERIAHRSDKALSNEESPEAVAEALREMISNAERDSDVSENVSIRQRDCDIVPRSYTIDWRIPILGPIHAVVRQVINAEIRRYLLSSLEKQSYFNRQMLRTVERLSQENARLRREIEELGRAPRG